MVPPEDGVLDVERGKRHASDRVAAAIQKLHSLQDRHAVGTVLNRPMQHNRVVQVNEEAKLVRI